MVQAINAADDAGSGAAATASVTYALALVELASSSWTSHSST